MGYWEHLVKQHGIIRSGFLAIAYLFCGVAIFAGIYDNLSRGDWSNVRLLCVIGLVYLTFAFSLLYESDGTVSQD